MKEDPGLSGLSGNDEIGELSKKEKKRKRVSAFEFPKIIVSKGIKRRTDMLALAHMQKNEAKTDMAEFIVNRGSKVVNDVLRTAWEMKKPGLLRSVQRSLVWKYFKRQGESHARVNKRGHAGMHRQLSY